MFLRLHTANELPGDAGAAGRGLPIKGKVLQGFVKGAVGWAALSADNCIVSGDCGVEGTMVPSQETRV